MSKTPTGFSDSVLDDLAEISRRACFDLWSLAEENGTPAGLAPRLIIPKSRGDKRRVSEQEARFLFCSALNGMSYYYAIETPTKGEYGARSQSALSDLTLYRPEGGALVRCANVELKAHNAPFEQIEKDVRKLIREGIPGCWFHLFDHVDGGTLPALFAKLRQSILTDASPGATASILFCIVALRPQRACLRRLEIGPSALDLPEYLERWFQLELPVRAGKVQTENINDWSWIEP